jgi:hypothetical protein
MATDAASGQPRRASQPGIQGLQQPPIADQVMQEADQVVAPDRLMQQISSLKSSIAEVQQGVQSGKIEAYKGIPFIKEQLSTLQQLEARLQPMQGIDSAPSNLPTEMAGGGIVAFDDGGLANEQEEDEEYGGMNAQDSALLEKYMAGITADSSSELDDDEEMPQGIMAVMTRGKETENRGVGVNPESKGGIGIKDVIAAKAAENKLPPELLNKIAGIESGYKSSAANPNSSAKGLFQFTDSTWKGMGGKEGEQFDPEKNAELGAKFVRQNAEGLKGALGRNPTYGEVYASHFFGLKGAKDILNMDPKTPMNQAVSAQVLKANPQLRDKTVGQVMAGLNNKMGEGIVSLAGGGVVAFGDPKLNPDENQVVEEPESAMGAFFKKGIIPEFGTKSEKDKKFAEDYIKGLKLKEQQQKALTAPDLNLPFYQAVKPSERQLVEDKRKAILNGNIPAPVAAASTTTQSAPSTPPTQQELDMFDAATRDFEKEQMGKSDEADIEDKVNARKAMGAGEEDITSLREMLTERAKSAKNQKSIDNYMALLQAGLGMMGGTSPYASANIGQGASKGIAHLADARKSQISEENALLSGRLGLSRAQLLETSRKNALARQYALDKQNYGLKTQQLDINRGKYNQAERKLLLEAEDLFEKKGGDALLRQEFAKQYGKNWANDLMKKKLFDAQRQEQVSRLYNLAGASDYPSASSLLNG